MSYATTLTSSASRTNLIGEMPFVIEKALGPVHQRVDVFGRGKFRGTFVLDAVLPEIFVSDKTVVRITNTSSLLDGHLGPADMTGHYDQGEGGGFSDPDLTWADIERERTS